MPFAYTPPYAARRYPLPTLEHVSVGDGPRESVQTRPFSAIEYATSPFLRARIKSTYYTYNNTYDIHQRQPAYTSADQGCGEGEMSRYLIGNKHIVIIVFAHGSLYVAARAFAKSCEIYGIKHELRTLYIL